VDGEAAARAAADSTLTSNLSTEVANRVSGDNALGTRVDNLTNSTNSDVSSLQSQINSVVSALSSETSGRSSVDVDLLNRIDMLFLYFFHHSSDGATIDANHQINFLYGNPI